MARVNGVNLIALAMDDGEALEGSFVDVEKGDSEDSGLTVMNFRVKCFDEAEGRFNVVPVTVWGAEEVAQCLKFLKKDSLVCVQGELRYKWHYNKETKKMEKVFTTVKASNVEFLTKKMKNEKLYYFVNEVMLVGNLVNDPFVSENGEETFVLAVDRLAPSSAKLPNHKTTDYVHLVLKDAARMKNKLQKGSTAIVRGNLMSRKVTGDAVPKLVVNIREIVGR